MSQAIPKKRHGIFDVEFIMLFGVILPVITLAVEAMTHMCASSYVDPIPSYWHIACISFVAVANCIGWWKIINDDVSARWLPFLIGASIGISAFYALIFAPMVPAGVFLLIALGLGFLPLAPLLSFICAVRLFFLVRRGRDDRKMRGVLAGFLAGVLVLIAGELPNVTTQIGLRQAVTKDEANTSRAGIRLLRAFGNENALLRSCYHHTASVSDISSLLFAKWHWDHQFVWHEEAHPVTVEEARRIYYRAYGRPFNSVARPHFSTGIRSAEVDEFIYWNDDSELAGENVGGRTQGVSLASSTLVASMHPDSASSYSEWTMIFHNKSYAQQEARMQIELPPGGVVTRATLWVNGQQREAAFGERSLVRHAYQAVVASKRDPLLITSAGPNKIMLQCFPVPPRDYHSEKDGEMTVRIGITAPCTLPSAGEASLTLPRIAEHGFPILCKHSVRVEGPTKTLLNADIDESRLRDEPLVVKTPRNATLATYWSPAPLSQGKQVVVEKLKEQKTTKPSELYIVIDGAGAMEKYIPQVAGGLAKVPADIPSHIFFVSDEISSLTGTKSGADLQSSLRALLNAPCVGGPDNASVLRHAWIEAGDKPNAAILWIHGPQPTVSFSNEFADQDVFDPLLAKHQPTIYDVELYPAPNRILEKAPPTANVIQCTRTGPLEPDLEKFIGTICGTTPSTYVFARSLSEEQPKEGGTTVIPSISAQLMSLWAYDETMGLIKQNKTNEAVKLASRQRLVTPVSGAVVLETDADYKKNGIDPTNPDNIDPSKAATPVFQIGAAPEPEEYVLLIAALAVVAWHCRRFKFTRRAA